MDKLAEWGLGAGGGDIGHSHSAEWRAEDRGQEGKKVGGRRCRKDNVGDSQKLLTILICWRSQKLRTLQTAQAKSKRGGGERGRGGKKGRGGR